MKYRYEILNGDSVIEESDDLYDAEEEAREEGENYIYGSYDAWEREGEEYEENDLTVEIEEVPEYKWELWYDSTLLKEGICEDEDEAKEEAQEELEARIEYWKLDGAWDEYDSEDYFEIIIEEEV